MEEEAEEEELEAEEDEEPPTVTLTPEAMRICRRFANSPS